MIGIEDVSRFVLAVIVCLIIFLIGVQVGKKIANRERRFQPVGNCGQSALTITVNFCPESKPEINL